MKVLLLTDVHGDLEKLDQIISREEFEAVLCAGDLSDANDYEYEPRLSKVLDRLEEASGLVKAVPGNMDREEACVRSLIDRKMNIHKKIASFDGFEVVGFGGGQSPFDTYFEPSGEDIRDSLQVLHDRMVSDNKVAVIHQPPKDTEVDRIDGEHVGSPEVRELLESKDFRFALTGHIHESYGKDEIAGTKIVNPGAVCEGRYGVLKTGEEFSAGLKSLN